MKPLQLSPQAERVPLARATTAPPMELGKWALGSMVTGYVLLLIILPIGQLLLTTLEGGWQRFIAALTQPHAWFALQITLGLALIAAVINTVTGTVCAYALVRYPLPGKRVLNALVDLPFAIPTAVSGLMLLMLYGPKSWLGKTFSLYGIEIVYATPGIVLAMIFVTFPFTIRAVQPILQEMGQEMIEAARTMGANRWQVLWHVELPTILPGILAGFTLTFSRALAEFGSVVMVAGNIPFKTQVASVYIYGEVENGDFVGAGAVSIVLLLISFGLLLYQNFWMKRQRFGWWERILARWTRRKERAGELENWDI
ncbi:sulfate ABC transporter permease subunit CysT [Heliophilum fasciatum]|uniref:Sulfate transport system permease protein n=1 Tax=Heliophilum fasciatum TaxID=35700 RepID=A0A4R2RYU7_9FIRM|nr:sulfate ABC transporter permease subunit CysT [Heliophilum fasciatum]MCW2276801.1 sulfate transport system permease protein [Heliophilum fasciatum]TCP68738.1 sulfate transport system permease protein [Heliophilum fasciatum]